jgi:hypothetical protein
MENIIVTTWGLGASYRKRVIHNIQKAIDTKYDNVLPYIILTDKPSDFYELQDKTKKIIDIVDFHAMREKYSPSSEEYEYVSKEIDDEGKFGVDFRKSYSQGKRFSYALHRFSLPRISELGYNRFLHCDCDTDIRYDKIVSGEVTEEEFWNEFDTPVNTMKGCDLEYQKMSTECGKCWANITILVGNILRYEMSIRHPEYMGKLYCLKIDHIQTEGPFRYYNLENSSMIHQYFLFWDEICKMSLTHPYLKQGIGGSYMYVDNVMHTVTNDMFEITPLNFDKKWHTVNIYLGDRFYFPRPMDAVINGKKVEIKEADTKEKFLIINKELIDVLKQSGELF